MTGTAAAVGDRGGLLEKLLAAVRPEFRVDVLLPDAGDVVLGARPCTVPGCDRPDWEHGICNGHSQRWRRRGCPDLAEFRADPGPPLRGRSQPGHCTVAGCRFGTSGRGLCARHRDRWTRAGKPDPAVWAATAAELPTGERRECRLPFCLLWVEGENNVFCKSHTTRWRNLGSPELDEFVLDCTRVGLARIDFRGLAPQLKLEFQYAVQRRRDDQGGLGALPRGDVGSAPGDRERGDLAAGPHRGAMASTRPGPAAHRR